MTNKSISYRLSIFISLAVIGVFVIFIIVNYIFNQQILKQNIEHQAIGLSTQVNSKVSQYVISTREIALNLSEQVIYYNQNNDTEELIYMVMRKYDFLNAIHVNIDSSVNVENHSHFMLRVSDSLYYETSNTKIFDCENEEQIIAEVAAKKQKGWTRPFRCNKYGNVIASYYCPVKQVDAAGDTIIIGEVICELSLLKLNRQINEIEIQDNGFAFLVDDSGSFITHPNQDWIINQNIFGLSHKVFEISRSEFQNIIENNRSGSTIAYPEILDYEKSWVYYTPVNAADWYLIFVLPYHTLFADLYLTTLRLLFFAVLGIMAIYFIITYITKRQIEPLSDVTHQLNKFSSQAGNNSLDTLNEVQRVSESLKALKTWYARYKDEQTRALIKSNLQKQDLQQASEIQQSIIKTEFPAFPERKEIDIHAVYRSAREVSGDLFDFFFIDEENLVFTIGDVSGKGIPAAIFMSIAQTIIKSNAKFKKAKSIVNKANKELCTNNQHLFFLTLFLGVIKISKSELYYCNAAHTTTIVLKPDGKIKELNQAHGLPLGLYPEKEYADSKISIEKGDTIVLYTDGVTELQNEDKKQFGMKRFKETLQSLAGLEVSEITAGIESKLDEFRGKAPQYDDISILIVKYNG